MSSSSHKTKTPRITLIALICVIGVIRGEVFAERKQSVGVSIDFMGGVSNQLGQSSYMKDLEKFFGVYPSVSLTSHGQHSTIDLNYNFVVERFQTDPGTTTTSHAFTASIDAQMGRRTHFRLSDTFNTAPDYSTINVLKGIAPIDGGFQYVFEPQLYRRSSISNSSSIGLDVDLTEKSFLTFGALGSFRRYEEEGANANLSNQVRVEGNFAFSHKQSKRLTWNLKYRVWQNDYDKYETTRSHAATFGLTGELSPNLDLSLEAGPSFMEDRDVSYVVHANISRQFRTNRLSAGYSHYSNDSTGLGGTTDSDQVTMSFSQALGRTTSINFQGSAFRQSSLQGYEGVYGSLAISQQLGRYWVATAGSSYSSQSSYTSERFYVSIGYRFATRRHELQELH